MNSRAFWLLWGLSTLAWGWVLAGGARGFDLPTIGPPMLLMLATIVAFMRWLPGARVADSPIATRRIRFFLAALLVILAFALAYAVAGKALIFAFPVLALVALLIFRLPVRREALLYSLGLAVVAALAGIPAGWWTYPAEVRSPLQLALVLTCLPAGWGILKRAGLLDQGVGASTFLREGARPALGAFAGGALLAIPWALMNVASGGGSQDAWATEPWAPLVALQPGIAEEAWGRVFLVSLAYLALRRSAAPRLAMTAAVVIVGYWFAYLHTDGGFGAIFSTLLIGTLYSLPLSYLWLRRGFEAAVGFHFLVDASRYAAAYLANSGLLR